MGTRRNRKHLTLHHLMEQVWESYRDTQRVKRIRVGAEEALIVSLMNILTTLTWRESWVILNRYLGKMTLQDVADLAERSKERIRQIEAKAIRKLQYPGRRKHFKPYIDFKKEESHESD